jgi:hypothetical protein
MSPAPVGAGFGGYSNFPVVHVGAADSMRYNAPTAGYRNDFEAFPSGSPVPGVMLQVPNDARGGNLACTTTGGSRRRGGATNPADAAEGTIRKKYATSIGENAVHGSDSDENAAIEGAFHFAGREQF